MTSLWPAIRDYSAHRSILLVFWCSIRQEGQHLGNCPLDIWEEIILDILNNSSHWRYFKVCFSFVYIGEGPFKGFFSEILSGILHMWSMQKQDTYRYYAVKFHLVAM